MDTDTTTDELICHECGEPIPHALEVASLSAALYWHVDCVQWDDVDEPERDCE